jgi:hypothetical protein
VSQPCSHHWRRIHALACLQNAVILQAATLFCSHRSIENRLGEGRGDGGEPDGVGNRLDHSSFRANVPHVLSPPPRIRPPHTYSGGLMAPTPAAIRRRAGSADRAGGRDAAAATIISHKAATTWRPSGPRWVGPCDGLGSPHVRRTAGRGSDRQAVGGLMRRLPGKPVTPQECREERGLRGRHRMYLARGTWRSGFLGAKTKVADFHALSGRGKKPTPYAGRIRRTPVTLHPAAAS